MRRSLGTQMELDWTLRLYYLYTRTVKAIVFRKGCRWMEKISLTLGRSTYRNRWGHIKCVLVWVSEWPAWMVYLNRSSSSPSTHRLRGAVSVGLFDLHERWWPKHDWFHWVPLLSLCSDGCLLYDDAIEWDSANAQWDWVRINLFLISFKFAAIPIEKTN